MSSLFAVGFAVPIGATWTTPAEASSPCSVLSGSDSWTGSISGGGSYTVSIAYNTGVSVTGTPPPLASLPIVLTSTSGHSLTISADAAGGRVYSGSFDTTTDQFCACQSQVCDIWDTKCVSGANWFCEIKSSSTCRQTQCGGGVGGSCSGGGCSTTTDFVARI